MSRLIRLAGVLALAAACLPAASASALSFPVQNSNSAGPGSLHAAIEEANLHSGLDSIPIEVTGTIGLEEELPPITDEVTITGPGAESLTVERTVSTPFRIFKFEFVDVTVSGLTVSGGKAASGGGIINMGGVLTLIRVAVTGNEAFQEGSGTTSAAGGGIRSTGPVTLRESIVAGNSVEARGPGATLATGGGIDTESSITVERSTISGNSVRAFGEEGDQAAAEGGGLSMTGLVLRIEGSTISGNSVHAAEGPSASVARGGGLVTSDLTVTGSTIAGNSAEAEESAGFTIVLGANIEEQPGATVVLGGTVVADPLGGAESCARGVVPGGTGFSSAGYNLDEDGSCGLEESSDLASVVAGLEPLADNGGPTPTHALRADSPAVDRATSFGLTTDQRGLPRPSDFPDVSNKEGGDGSDIGAFELQVPPPAAGGGSPVVVTERPTDRTPPNTRIVSGPPRVTFKAKARFRFASTEAQSHFQCKLDKRKWRACANPFRRSVKPGKHLFKVRAIDRFGNVDPTPARFGWRVKRISG